MGFSHLGEDKDRLSVLELHGHKKCAILYGLKLSMNLSAHMYTLTTTLYSLQISQLATMLKVASLADHACRVLYPAILPSRQMDRQLSEAGDETLRFWNLFPHPKSQLVSNWKWEGHHVVRKNTQTKEHGPKKKMSVSSTTSNFMVKVAGDLSLKLLSCRLRWINYLRPDLKRGNFTEDEDELIINLHSLLGNNVTVTWKNRQRDKELLEHPHQAETP
ncbi:hypothetical protein FEM48_Zijuj04G0199800 [Ziziphus jujuba var. spinosa]|uniref:HTH myb-type domain-containing protein n=1 Tax=Ziziphus jujuba var. spinosa TaxID=714518 RepID=A0A978VLW5_ZIZJJ|nr:hypothetical protein FEM48_Zijuj04G0199800 [Ziziphus jujuba var. spinosa]